MEDRQILYIVSMSASGLRLDKYPCRLQDRKTTV